MNLQPLPIDDYLTQIARIIENGNRLIVQAPPGTGKTTRLAPSLLDLPTLSGCIALIQPRQIAARSTAARIASDRSCAVGDIVGYQVRFDSRYGQRTRLISMTPGILLRRLQSDPLLEQFSAIILDEFHERSQELDLILGLAYQLQTQLRPEFRIVVMSATLDCGQIAQYLDDPPTLSIEAINHPVEIHHSRFAAPQPRQSPSRRIIETAIAATENAIRQQTGDVLVFLPGVGEIMQVKSQLESLADRLDCELLMLFGELPAQDQDRVLAPGPRRRVILSTNVAETSLTIEGVRVVIDSGWARVKRFDPATGLDTLRLEPISQASAKQRAGRAGRTQPGVCYRLWDEITGRSRAAQLEPEVLRADLMPAVLQLIHWGHCPEQFPWLTSPSTDAIDQARCLLEWLGAIHNDRLTDLGKILIKFPLHPRLARLLVAAHQLKIPTVGAMAAALLSERDLFLKSAATDNRSRSNKPYTTQQRKWNCDLTQRIISWYQYMQDGRTETPLGNINVSAERTLRRSADQYYAIAQAELGSQSDDSLDDQLSQALLAAYPDRLALRRSATGPRALMVGGRGVQLENGSGVQSELFLCLDVDAGGSEASVRSASHIDRQWLPTQWLREADERFYNPTQQSIVARRRSYFIDLLLSETPISTPLDDETAMMLSVEAAKNFQRLLPPKDKELHSLLSRIEWLTDAMPEANLPKLSGSDLAAALKDWCVGKRSLDELKQMQWTAWLNSLLDTPQRKLLDQQAPESICLPGGRKVLLQYQVGKSPILEARIQEFFGWKATPLIAGGRVPLMLHLLAPNQRCQQITDDLASFWKNTYPIVRKELRGRYPKHAWPEDPTAEVDVVE